MIAACVAFLLSAASPVFAQTTLAPPPDAAPSPAPVIRLDRARLGLVPGASATIGVAGAIGPLSVQPSFDGVEAVYDRVTRRLVVTGRSAGNGTLALTDAAGNTASVAILVAPPAGTLPGAIQLEFAGTVSGPFVATRIRSAIDRASQREPGTTLDVHGITLPAALAPGDVLDAAAGVTLGGRGAFVDVPGRVDVHVHVDPEPRLDPLVLYYSDDPEYVNQDGVLFHATVDAATPARFFIYHVAAGTPRRISLVLQSDVVSHVQILGSSPGPSPQFSYVGQQASARFLRVRDSQESVIVTLAPGVPYEIPFGPLNPGDLLEAIEDVRVLDGGPLRAAVASAALDAPLPPLDAPEIAGDSHGRRGVFSLAGIAPIELTLAAGSTEPAPASVGYPGLTNLRPDGRPLAGDYGVVRPVALHISNPTPNPQDVFLYELTSGTGGATATMWFDGEDAATLIPCVDDAAQPHAVKRFTLAAGEARTVTGTFMTDGAASYPVRFGLTTTLPTATGANACG